jgi:L-lactate utilization protein LutC
MSARERILRRIAEATAARPAPARPGHVRPAVTGPDPVTRFCAELEAAMAEWVAVPDRAQVPAAVREYRERGGLGGPVVVAPGLQDIDWAQQLAVGFGSADGAAEVGVNEAVAGVAETGTLVLASSPDRPALLNFLPDHALVVLERRRVVATLEEGWAAVGAAPRVVNLVTGPSRTADVEQTIQIGAHGPRRLCVLLVD